MIKCQLLIMTNKNIIDIAVLAQEINKPYKIDENIPIFELVAKTPILSVENFIRLFYNNGISNKFCVNSNKGSLIGTKQTGYLFSNSNNKLVSESLINYISFKNQSMTRDGCDYGDSLPFNLKDAIFSSYSSPDTGIGVSPYCWTACSRIELTDQLLKICYLFNICNVCCSLTFIEALESILSDNSFNLYDNSILTFRVSVVFTNDNEHIKDVIVRFNYVVDMDTGRGIIPNDIYKKFEFNVCDENYCVPKGNIKKLNFIYNDYYFKNRNIKLSDETNWTEQNEYYISRQIKITNNMKTLSKNELSLNNQVLNEIFKIRILIKKHHYHRFKNYGYIDQTKLCVEIESSTPHHFCIGDTINLANNDSINRGNIINGVIEYMCNFPDSVEYIFPVAINILFKKSECEFFTFGDIQCNPLLLTVCKIC